MSADRNETLIKTAFSSLKDARVEAPPFMKSRVLARLESGKRASREMWLWRVIAGAATLACVALLVLKSPLLSSPVDEKDPLLAMKPYVIHVDFGSEKLDGAMVAEVELPEGVRFFSKAHPEISKLSSMRMDIPDVIEGRSRLPFVVTAERPGVAQLKVRILDENNQLVRERVISVSFVEGKRTSVL